jgi:hypothetical protein
VCMSRILYYKARYHQYRIRHSEQTQAASGLAWASSPIVPANSRVSAT